jgi:hypothetical protein
MKRSMILLAAPLALAASGALSGCVTDGYGGGGIAYGDPYAYDGYYDGFYGSVYDGYWGNDGYFYYRGNANDHRFRRGDRAHFGRQAGAGTGWRPMHGNFQPSHGMHMPSFPHNGGGGGGGHGHHGH